MISKRTISRYKILLMLLVVIGVGVSATECPPISINPLYSDETVVFEPAFLGTWTAAGDESFVVEKRGDESYTVTYRDDDWLVNPLEVHLVQLGQHYYVDIYPEDGLQGAVEKGYYPYLPTHAFLAVELEGDVLKLGMLHNDWLQEKLESGEDIQYAHYASERECPFLIGSTEELQRFFLKYGEDEDAFEWDEFQRQRR